MRWIGSCAWILLWCGSLSADEPRLIEEPDNQAVATPSTGDEATNDAQREQLQRLVQQLDARSATERAEAEAALLAMGAAAIPFLGDPGERVSAEVRMRVGRILTELYRRQAVDFIGGGHVTLDGEFPLSEALEQLRRQSGNLLQDYRQAFGQPTDDPTLRLELEDVPFWQALDAVLDQTGMTVYPYSGEPGLSLVKRASEDLQRSELVAYYGAFRFVPKSIAAQRDLQARDVRSLTFSFEAAWEPRLRPIAVRLPMRSVLVETEAGTPVDVAQPAAVLEYSGGGTQQMVTVQIPLVPPPPATEMLRSIAGQLRVLVPGQVEQFRFSGLDANPRNVIQRKANATVVLESVRKNNAIWQVRVAVMFEEAADALESHRTWIFDNQAYLLAATGERIRPDGMETTRHNPRELGMAYVFELPEGVSDLEFVYETPVAVFDLPVEFELKDIPLP